jgi:hypothetical protein
VAPIFVVCWYRAPHSLWSSEYSAPPAAASARLAQPAGSSVRTAPPVESSARTEQPAFAAANRVSPSECPLLRLLVEVASFRPSRRGRALPKRREDQKPAVEVGRARLEFHVPAVVAPAPLLVRLRRHQLRAQEGPHC